MEKENHYETLEVPETADSEEIKKAYRRLSLKYHPDRNPGKPEVVAIFQKIGSAFEVLGDSDKKKEYDFSRKNPFMRMHSNGPHMNGNPFQQMDEMFSQMFFGGGIPGMGGIHMGGPGGIHMGGPGGIHMGGPGGIHMRPNVQIFRNGVPINMVQKPAPITQNIQINMEQVLTGSTLPVEIERWILENGNKVFEKETIYVPIPKGIDENEMIVLKDQGNIVNDNCKGDIKIFVKIENNSGFQRNGLDLMYDKKISLKDSLCGFSFELKYINGKTYTINNQRGNIIPPEYTKVIPNMGITREGHIGNLLIHFKVEFPETLTEEQLEKLSDIF